MKALNAFIFMTLTENKIINELEGVIILVERGFLSTNVDWLLP